MSTIPSSSFLRRVLLADGVSCALSGLALLFGAAALSALLGLPPLLLQFAGGALLAFGLPVTWLATRKQLPRAALRAVIGVNVVWAIDSVLLLVSGYVAPTLFGQAFVIAQAAVAAVFAELQFIGLRRPVFSAAPARA
jgi:hypothetical protein